MDRPEEGEGAALKALLLSLRETKSDSAAPQQARNLQRKRQLRALKVLHPVLLSSSNLFQMFGRWK